MTKKPFNQHLIDCGARPSHEPGEMAIATPAQAVAALHCFAEQEAWPSPWESWVIHVSALTFCWSDDQRIPMSPTLLTSNIAGGDLLGHLMKAAREGVPIVRLTGVSLQRAMGPWTATKRGECGRFCMTGIGPNTRRMSDG